MKLVENDPVAMELFGFEDLDEIRERHRKEHPNIETDIMVTRAGYASLIAREVQRIVSHDWRLNWLDNLIINNPAGSVIFTLAVFTGIFAALLYIGGWFQDVLGDWFDSLLDSLSPWLQSQNYLVKLLVKNSLTGLAAGISVAVPYIFIFYFILAFLEDSGVLARFIVVLNKLMGKLGLPGKAVIPIMLGFGCTVPAIRATRVLPEFRDRLKVAILYMTVPCSSRSSIIFGVVGHYAGAAYAIGIYVASFVVFVITAKLLNVVIPPERIPMVEELPPYRRPLLKNIALKAWIRMQDFVYIVIPLLIAGGMAYGALLHVNLVQPLIDPFRPLTVGWLHIPAETIIPMIYGFLQKDLVPAMLANVLGTTNFSAVMSSVQLFTFGLASTFQIPCIIAFSMLAKEFGLKRALIIEVSAFAYGMLWAGIIGRIVALALGMPF
ncbi:Fe2+ transport system protein B [Thermococcus stetteri]|nr:Fe2+ transport system protein B [Thermococcus stetteri]